MKTLASYWIKPEGVQTVAPTGIAPVNMGDSTVQSFSKIGKRCRELRKFTDRDRDKFSKPVICLWYEIGINSEKKLAQAFKQLHRYFDTTAAQKYRINVVLFGDIF